MTWRTRFFFLNPNSRLAARIGLIVLLICVWRFLYLPTLDNGLRLGELSGGDLITHQYAQVQARPSNAPGYPLYTLGGWFWFHAGRLVAPQSNPISLLASYSTWWALLALAVLYQLLLRLTQRNWPLAWLVTAIYAATYFFWFYAVTTEQYTSAVLLTLLFVWAACRWDEAAARQRNASATQQADRWLAALALFTGVALAHMVTVLAIAPPIAYLVLSRQPDVLRRPRLLAGLLLAMLIPLLSYAFIYARGAQHPEWRGSDYAQTAWAWFWSFVSTSQGRSELTWSLSPLWTSEWPALLWRELTPVGAAAGLVGWGLLGRRLGGILAGAALIYLAFSFIDRLGNWYQVVMPVYALLALGLGVVGDRLTRWAARRLPHGSWQHSASALLLMGLALFLANRVALNWARVDQSDQAADTGLAPGWAILADAPAGAAVLGTAAEADALRYLTIIGDVRPDVHAVTSAEASDRLRAGDRLFSSAAAAPLIVQEVMARPHWRAVGPALLEVMTAPVIVSSAPDGHLIGDGLAVISAAARLVEPQRRPAWPAWAPTIPLTPSLAVSLTWLAQAQPTVDWAVSVRALRQGQPLTAGNQPVQFDVRHPVDGVYPTTAWMTGERVEDRYRVPLPTDQQPDAAQIILYRQLDNGRFENLGSVTIPIMP
jgi:hypothetical protein